MRTHYELRYDLLRNPRFRAFLQTPIWVTFLFITARAMPRIESFQPGSDIPDLSDVYHLGDDEYLVPIAPPRATSPETGLRGRGWLCTVSSAEQLHRRFPERAVELIEADIEQLAAMGLLEIRHVMLNGEETRVLKVGEWVVGEPFDSD